MFAARLCFAEALDGGWLVHPANISMSVNQREVRPWSESSPGAYANSESHAVSSHATALEKP
jgi:hypothetical protein